MAGGFVVGADLGQSVDHSAIAVVERTTPEVGPAVYLVRHLERLPLGTPYPRVCERLVELFAAPPLSGGTLVVDETGVGRPVVDLLRRLPLRATLVPVTITSGSRASPGAGGRWRVPKRELVAAVQAILASGRLKVAEGLPEAEALLRELAGFEVSVTAAANETFGAAPGGHDDLVLAVALAAWVPGSDR